MNNVASNVSARNLLATCSDYLGNFFQILPTLRFVFKIKYAEAIVCHSKEITQHLLRTSLPGVTIEQHYQ